MDSVVLLSIVSFFLELTVKKRIKLFQFLRNLILNPMILAILIGLIIRISKINIDETPF